MSNRRVAVRLGVVLALVCVVGLLGGHAQAVDYVFDPLGVGSDDWWVSGNWTPGGFPNSVNDRAIFDASANPSYSTNTHPSSPYTVREMRFDTSSNWRIHNNERDINLDAPSGNALITQNGSGTVTFDSDWILIDNTTLGGTGSGEVILNGSILGSSSQRRGIFGAGSLTKEGSFTATINPIIQHTGGTTVNDGILRLNKGGLPLGVGTGQFGSPHTVTVNNGGTLQLTNIWVMGDGVQNQVVVNEGGTLQFLNSDNYLSNITLRGGAITTSGGTRPWRTGNFGPGLITVNPSATTSTVAGSLCLVGTGAGPTTTFDVAGGGQVDVSSHIYDHPGFEGAMRLVKRGDGKLTLTSTTSSWDGGLSINGGTVSVPTLTAGNTNGPLGGSFGTSGYLSFDGGTLEYTGGSVGGINRAFLINAGGATLDITNAAATVTWTDAAGAGPITGPGGLTKAGPGTLILAGSNNYAGGTIISQGTLQFGQSGSAGSGVITLGDASTGANEVRINMPSNTSWPPPIALPNDINVSNLAGGRAVIAGVGGTYAAVYQGTVALQNKDVIFRNDIPGDRTAIEGKITGTGNVTIEGSGRVNFANAGSDFAGDVTIVPGATLQTVFNDNIPDTADVTVDGRLGIYRGNEAIDALHGGGLVNAWSSGGAVRLTVGADNGSGTFSGSIQDGGGTVSLVKTGTGTQTLTGVNTYGGSTTIAGGTLKLQAPATTAPGGIGGLLVHLDANNVTGTGNPADGSQIGTWTNLASGGAGDFTGGGPQQPYLNWTGNPMNGNSAVHFWGGLLNNATNFGNDVTVMYVGRMDGGANARLVSSVGNNWLLGYWRNNMNTDYWNNGGQLSGALDYNSHIFMATGDGATARAYNIDGAEVQFDTRSLGGATQGPNGLSLGGWGLNGGEQSYADIGELLVFDHALSAADRLQMEQHLQAKWYGVLPATTAVDITASGATLDLNGVNQTIGSLAGVDGSQVLLNGAWLTIGQNHAGTTFSGAIGDGSTAGGGLSKVGTATLTLAGTSANTFTGPTVISRGRMALSKNAGVTAIPGDILMLNSLSPTMWMTADNQLGGNGILSFADEVNADIGNARFNLIGTTQSLAGIVATTPYRNGVIQNAEPAYGGPDNTGTGTLVLTGSGDYSFNGYLRDAHGTLQLTKTGSGTQALVGDRITYTGATTVSDGTLRLTNTTGFNSSIANSATVEIAAAAAGDSWNLNVGKTLSGDGTWIKTGPGRASLRNVTVTASGLFQIQEGTVRNDYNSSNWTGSTLDMDIWPGGVLDLYADPIYVDALTGAGTVQNGYAPSGMQTLTVGVANGSGTFSGPILGTGGDVALTKTGTGVQYLDGANTYSGLTTVNGGYLVARNNTALGSAAGGALVHSGATLQLEHASGITITGETATLNGTGVGGTRGALASWSGNNTWAGDVVLASDSSVYVYQHTLDISGAISGSSKLTKTGGGWAVLSGASSNTNTGTTAVGEGVLVLNKTGGAYAISGPLQMGTGTGQPHLRTYQPNQFAPGVVMEGMNPWGHWARFDLLGNDQTLAGISGNTDGLVIQNGGIGVGSAAGAALTVNTTTNDTFSGHMRDYDNVNLGGKLNLVKDGTGTLALAASPGGPRVNYTGGTAINDGTLTLQNLNGTWGFNSPVTVNPAGTLVVDSTVPFAARWNYGQTLSGSGTFIKKGTGVFGITGVNNFAGQMYIQVGRLMNDNVTGNWTGATADVDVSSGAVLDLRANDIYVDSLTGQAGAEIWNSHTAGGTRTLFVGVAGGSGTFAGVIRGTGTGVNDTPDAAPVNLEKRGAGTQILSGANTYTGTTTVNGGTLQVDGSIASSSGVTVALGATLAGSGAVPTVTGPGEVSPGASPGILTAPSINASAGMDFSFEFTAAGSPDYGNPAASINDVLRLTDTASPFGGIPLDAGNAIDVYLDVADLTVGEAYRGGIYTDRASGFLGDVDGATYNFFIRSDGLGPIAFEGDNYYALSDYSVDWHFAVSTVQDSADFGQGPIDGYVMQMTAAVPEPATMVLVAVALSSLAGYARRRRKRS